MKGRECGGVGGAGFGGAAERGEEIAAAFYEKLGPLGGGGELREAGEGGVVAVKLKFESQGAFDEGGGRADPGDAGVEIGKGGGGLGDESVGFEPKFGFGLRDSGQGGAEIGEGGGGIVIYDPSAGAEDTGGGNMGLRPQDGIEGADGSEAVAAGEVKFGAGEGKVGMGGLELVGKGEIGGGFGPAPVFDVAEGAAKMEVGTGGGGDDEGGEIGDRDLGSGMGTGGGEHREASGEKQKNAVGTPRHS